MSFSKNLENTLKQNKKFCDISGKVLKQKVKSYALVFDEDLITLLYENIDTKDHFFKNIGSATIFDYRKFIDFLEDKNFLLDSYTKFSNKIDLTISNKFMKQVDDVVLTFPFKDCILEGGQSNEEDNKKEIFFNETLAKDEITRLFDKKIITNSIKYYYEDNKVKENNDINFIRDENGIIKDNLLIKGNNLLALHTLKSNFSSKINLIYIDPPYYFKDKRNVDTFNYNSNFKLSSWLIFMKNRLEIARDLLDDDGVIFVHIGEDSQAYLEILMNEIFGVHNKISAISRVQKRGSDKGTYFKPTLDYILSYAKNKNNLKPFKVSIDANKFKKIEDHGERKGELYEDSKSLYQSSLDSRPNQRYYVKCPDGSFAIPPGSVYPEKINDGEKITPALQNDGIWRWEVNSYLGKKDLLTFKKTTSSPLIDEHGNKSKWNIYTKRYLKDAQKKGNIPSNLFEDFLNSSATNTLGNLDIDFSFSKPKELIEYLINISQLKEDAIILDFFGGSGTTAHAVLDINKEQDKNLQFIIVEQMDYIKNITKNRISKVIDNNSQSEFIYFELDKHNQKFIDDLSIATEATILTIYDEICKKAFINYDVDLKMIEEHIEDFKAFELSQQKEFLVSILNKNQLYNNYSEIDDESFDINENTKRLNKNFYNDKDEE